MKNYNSSENVNDEELPSISATPDVNASVGPSKMDPSTVGDSTAKAGADETPIGPRPAAPAKASGIPARVDESIKSTTTHSQSVGTKRILKVECIGELVRTSKNNMADWKPPFQVEEGSESSLKEIIQRADFLRTPWQATPVPTGSAHYGTTDELFLRLRQAIAEKAFLPEHTSALLSYWVISTWFSDGLSLAPGLVIVAPEFEGDLALRTLRCFCRYPLMLTRADNASLQGVDWRITPTLLFFAPNVTKQMATILGCATSRGYMAGDANEYKDFYGPKAIYVGEEVSADRIPRNCVQVTIHPTESASATQLPGSLNEGVVQDLQNQLLRYRLTNLVKVYLSDFNASALSSETRAVGNALGACIVDSSLLQFKLVSLLGPIECQRQADRSTSLEAVTLEATLNLCHKKKAQILVGEIATEVNRIVQARGERQHYNAERIGHRLKKVGLVTLRLGKAGRGFVLDLGTMARAHQLAAVYGGAGLEQEEDNVNCSFCIENRPVMQMV